jgi:hypothetical protein
LPGTAGLPPYISFSTSYPELSKETWLMSTHLTVSPNEAADRLAIRELVEAYADCADRRVPTVRWHFFRRPRTSWCT